MRRMLQKMGFAISLFLDRFKKKRKSIWDL